jgi:uracil-DNA glycosylase
MSAQTPPPSANDIAGAIDWWRLAGVDIDALDEPSGWLDSEIAPPVAATAAEPTPQPKPVEKVPPPPPPGAAIEGLAPVPGDAKAWPKDLTEFQRWWTQDENFAPAGAFPRIAPRGTAQAELMIVTGQPEQSDTSELLSGPQGQLLDGFMRAAGLASDAVYVASALPRHTLRPDWSEVGATGYGALLAHHITLVAPRRLLVFGRDVLALIPHELAQEPASLPVFNQEKLSIPLMSTRNLSNLVQRAGFKARFWQQWLDFTDS